MIYKLDITEKTSGKDVEDFITKACPYSDKNMKLVQIFQKLQENPLYSYIETLGNADKATNSEQYFLIWRNFDQTKLFVGVKFIKNEETVNGINLQNHEV